MSARVLFADRDMLVVERPCPSCGLTMEFHRMTPPIPMTLYGWTLDGERWRFECPACDAELPDGPWEEM